MRTLTVSHMVNADPMVIAEISLTTQTDPVTGEPQPALFVRMRGWRDWYPGTWPSIEVMRRAVYEVFEPGHWARDLPIVPAFMRTNE